MYFVSCVMMIAPSAFVFAHAEDGLRDMAVTGVQTCAMSSRSEEFFFFQAEDGIRDVAVTGVQTCALPISAQPVGHLAQGEGLADQRAGVALEPGAHVVGLGVSGHDRDPPLQRGPAMDDGDRKSVV